LKQSSQPLGLIEHVLQLTGLKEHEEESEESGDDVVGGLSSKSVVVLSDDDEVGALSCPQWSGTQSHQH